MTLTTGHTSKAAFEKKLAALNGKLRKYGKPEIELKAYRPREVEMTVSYGAFGAIERVWVADVELSDISLSNLIAAAMSYGIWIATR